MTTEPATGPGPESAIEPRTEPITGVIVLPGVDVTPYGTVPAHLAVLTEAWLRAQRSIHTRTAYRRDVAQAPPRMKVPGWLPWCAERGLDPLAVRKANVDTYRMELEAVGSAPATIARKLSAISSWYDYLCDEDAAESNPAKRATRPDVDRDTSTTTGLTQAEAAALLAEASRDSALAEAMVALLLYLGVRVSVVLTALGKQFGYDSGHRTLTYVLKGGKVTKAPLPPPVGMALDAWIEVRPGGPPGETELMFIRDDAAHADQAGWPIDRPWLYRLVRRLARRAGIPSADDLCIHSLRHSFATFSYDADIPDAVIQDAMGHRDGRTTRRYDRARNRLNKHPGYVLAATINREGAAEDG